MSKSEEYLRRAVECVEMANRAPTAEEKTKLLDIARAWRELAETGITSIPSDAPYPPKR
jgi:hypothetical protein